MFGPKSNIDLQITTTLNLIKIYDVKRFMLGLIKMIIRVDDRFYICSLILQYFPQYLVNQQSSRQKLKV